MKTIVHVIGARPNYMKIAPLMEAVTTTGLFRQVLVNTGQHYDDMMARAFVRDLGLPTPDYDLGVGSAPGQFRVPAGDRGWLRPGTLADGPRNPETRYVEAVVNAATCRPGTTITFRYDPARPDTDFSYAVPLDSVSRSGATRIFEAVYDNFQGLDVSDSSPGCLQEVLVLTHLDQFPLLLPARLSPGWEGRPQYQRITFFGARR